MPFVLIALFSLMSPGFLSPFFESMAGMALLAAALVMQVAGVVLVHRILRLFQRLHEGEPRPKAHAQPAALVMQVAGVVLVHRILDAGGRRS